MKWKCPKCDSSSLEVVVEVHAALFQNKNGFETSIECADDDSHEWNENSVMTCMDCGEQNIADSFQCTTENEEEMEDDE